MNARLIRIGVSILFLVVVVGAFGPVPVLLELHPKIGTQYQTKVTIKQQTSYRNGAKTLTSVQTTITDYVMRIAGRDTNGVLRLGATYARMTVNQSSDDVGNSYSMTADTKDPSRNSGTNASEFAQKMSKLIGLTYHSTFTKRGRQASTDQDTLLARAYETEVSPDPGGELFFPIYPAHAVNVGATWHETSVKQLATVGVRTETDYTLTSANASTAEIGFHATMKSTAPDDPTEVKLVGTYTVDRKTGWTLHGSISQESTQSEGSTTVRVVSDITVDSVPTR